MENVTNYFMCFILTIGYGIIETHK